MGAITEIFRSYGPQYLATHPELPKEQKKVLAAIINCRSGAYGITVYRCTECGKTLHLDRSCGNRHCPQCQYLKSRKWLDSQLQRKLPCSYFMLTFTMPSEMRPFCLRFQQQAYGAMFKAAASAIRKLAKDPRFIGADMTGFTGILHTWGRQMQYHPHIHFIAPAGGLSNNRDKWLGSRNTFYLPVKALSRIYRAVFKAEMEKAELLADIPTHVWSIPWNVNCQPVGDGEASLKYLAPYVFRVAISDSRIVSVDGRNVTFAYRRSGSNRPRRSTVDALKFIRRFLLHVLPHGFMKVRHYGFFSAAATVPLVKLRILILSALERSVSEFGRIVPVPIIPVHQTPPCRVCGGKLDYLCSIIQGVPFRGPT